MNCSMVTGLFLLFAYLENQIRTFRCRRARRTLRISLIASLLLGICSQIAFSARHVKVNELGRALADARSTKRPDYEVAQQIAGLELTERPDSATVADWISNSPGQKTSQTLIALSDAAAFLDPPPAEILAIPVPDLETQRRMISLAVDFTAKTLSHLPDFFADRVTASFDDSPQTFRPGDVPIRLGMHVIGASSAEIAFRDGREREDPGIKKAKKPRPSSLVSWGEFGPILSTVLTDATKGRLEWSHWEQGSADPVAVFRFAVTRKASNYMVNYCCIQVLDEPTPFAGGDVISNDSLTSTAFHQMVAYHGTLSLDPATGTISRLVIQADLKPSDPIEGADIVVEYGKVRIGDKVFTCPVKSVSLARVPVAASAYPNVKSRLMLNDVAFRNYHHFEATVRILPDQVPSATAIETLKDPPEKDAALASATSGTVPSREETTPSTIFNPAPQSAASAPSEQSNETTMPMIGATRPPSTSPGDGIPETSSESATPFPQGEPEPGSITLRVISRLVNADIVAYDKNNHPVRDLKAEDFEVYDNGKKQKIRFFSAPAGSLPVATSASQPLQSTFSNGADQATRQSASARDSVCTILLIDEAHVAWSDLHDLRQQILVFLDSLSPGARVGIYSTPASGFRVIEEVTTDHAALIAYLQKWMPTAQSVAHAQEEETRNRQHIDEVRSVADLNAVNGHSTNDPMDGASDPQLRSMGDNAGRDSLVLLAGVARHLATIPGHKSLVWISSDNVFADWQDRAVGADQGPSHLNTSARRVLESMNDAQVMVYPMDVSQVEGGAISADLQHRNVEMAQTAQGAPIPQDMTGGRITAQMQQDVRAIQEPVREIADATGGRVIRRASDQAKALAGIVEDANANYSLDFSPDGPADDKYHTITIKLVSKRGILLRYRSGYFFAKEADSLKERFAQAVWQPIDSREISLTANVAREANSTSVKVMIAAADLSLHRQGDRWMDKLEIFFVQRDDSGIHAQVDGQVLALRLSDGTYQKVLHEGVPFERSVQLGPGATSLRVLVVDADSGRIGSVTIPCSSLGRCF